MRGKMSDAGRDDGCDELLIPLDRLMFWCLISSLMLVAGILVYIYYLRKGQFDDPEDVKYQMFRETGIRSRNMPKYRNSLNDDPDDQDPKISRRSFLALMGVGACIVGRWAAGQDASILGFLYPNAMKIPPSVFSIGRPRSVIASEGKVFNPKQKVFIETREGKVQSADSRLHTSWAVLSIWWRQAMPVLAMDRLMTGMEEIPAARRLCL